MIGSADLGRLRNIIGDESKRVHRRSWYEPEELFLENEGYFDRIFKFSGFSRRDRQAFLAKFALIAVLSITITYTVSWVFSILAALVVCLFFFKRISIHIRYRSRGFEKDYTAFLLSFASSVRTGADPLVAFYQSADLFEKDSILRRELLRFRRMLESGLTEDQAIANFASSIRLQDLALLRTAVILARKQGASLAQCLQRLARVTRQRQSFRRKIKAALAMQRMSALGISGCAIIIGVFQFVTNQGGTVMALSQPAGKFFLSMGVGMMLIGLFWMLGLSRDRE